MPRRPVPVHGSGITRPGWTSAITSAGRSPAPTTDSYGPSARPPRRRRSGSSCRPWRKPALNPPDDSEILLVEDDADLAEVVALVLEQAGFHVAMASNGVEALQRVQNHMPALILLDMLMPVMDGWQFAREFRSRHGAATPIVVLTAA